MIFKFVFICNVDADANISALFLTVCALGCENFVLSVKIYQINGSVLFSGETG